MENLAEKIENIDSLNSLHGNSQGWITRAEISEEEGFKQWHYRFKELIKQDLNGKDIYISMNTFYKTYRRIDCLKELRACYIDLDIYNTKFTKEQVMMNLEENYYNQSIPIPNFVMDSGRGLYLIWLINTVPSKALPLWKAIEEYLYKELKDFGADRKALDPTRILRVEGSINSKSNTRVKVLDENNYIYDLREIQKNFLPELQPSKNKKGRPKKTVYIHRERSLYQARLNDLITICELREYDLRGHRELILFLYRYYLCYFTEDTEKALQDTLELNSEFIVPLREKEVISATRSAERVYLKQDKQYKYKNETLIELLDITEQEQMKLSIIFSKEEYKRRDREYHKKVDKKKYQEKLKSQGKLTEKEKISQRRAKVKDLLAEGLKQKDICLKMNISKRNCIRDIKYLKEQGLI